MRTDRVIATFVISAYLYVSVNGCAVYNLISARSDFRQLGSWHLGRKLSSSTTISGRVLEPLQGQSIPRSRFRPKPGEPHLIHLIFSGFLLEDHITLLRKFQIPTTSRACTTAELGLLRLGMKPLFQVSPGHYISAGLGEICFGSL